MSSWYSKAGKDSDVVLFSKVRLARNLFDAPFPNRMNKDIKKNVTKKLYAAMKNSSLAGEFSLVNLEEVNPINAVSFAEKQVISPEFAKEKGAFLISQDESVSVMLCEEDHIRITSFESGLDVFEAYKKADKTDDVFLNSLHIAFDENLGFLTASPINIGTGMKVSIGLFIPAIKASGELAKFVAMVGKLGLTLRPLYSDKGAFYLLSNQVSLGITEKAAMDNITAIANQIVVNERSLRENIKNNEEWEDKLFRSLGTLKMARKLDFAEFINLISDVRLGTSLSYFDYEISDIDCLINTLADASVLSKAKSEENPELVQKLRAKIIRNSLD